MNRRIKSCTTPAQLCGLVLDEVKSFDEQNVPHALSRLAKMFRKRTKWLDEPSRRQTYAELLPAVDALTKRMLQLVGNYDSWDTSLSLWSYGQLGHHDEAALRALCDAALGVAPIFKPADCANTLVAFANLDFMHRELLKQLVVTVLDTLDDFQPGELAQVLWGFARVGCHPGEHFVEELVEAVQWRMQYYSTQELTMVLWSLVRLRHRPGLRFLQLAEGTLLQRLPHMAPVDVCVSVWTFAHLRYKAVRLLDEVPQAIAPQLHACKNSELCALVSAFATAHHFHRVMLEAVAAVAVPRLETISARDVAVLLWTYGAFHHRPAHPDFARAMAGALGARMRQFSPQGLAIVCKALAQLQWRSEPLMAELVAAAEAQLPGFK
ncbi:hypothetical protein GPECTOR_65g187 [Gonium pectorale]|uniref:RNA-editing substrate-binding complex 6 protein domain-containing protein n=1 Tax=Gonium pectorale TaxID=33097 RepID=A0A150G3V5_GONPE|nr:hypothetical protein GPECTOR_65g187 [Gonium pectorale]|eukprot:KXZ44569.1 hypothetical protein GPECTOR_65g187 [Gonium pectorale]